MKARKTRKCFTLPDDVEDSFAGNEKEPALSLSDGDTYVEYPKDGTSPRYWRVRSRMGSRVTLEYFASGFWLEGQPLTLAEVEAHIRINRSEKTWVVREAERRVEQEPVGLRYSTYVSMEELRNKMALFRRKTKALSKANRILARKESLGPERENTSKKRFVIEDLE